MIIGTTKDMREQGDTLQHALLCSTSIMNFAPTMSPHHPICIQRATLTFLSDLEVNNDRDWFAAHKDRYIAAQDNIRAFADALLARMQEQDKLSTVSGAKSLMRIYTDQRFHKDRPPYAPRFGGRFARVKPALRGGYFFRIQPGGRSSITCGFMGPNAADLRLIRMDMLYDHATWKKLLQAKVIRTNFGELQGEQLRTAPRGFPKDHEGIDLLRHTQFLLRRSVTDKEVLSPEFLEQVVTTFRSARPWFDHMSAVLTTNENGQ